MEIVLLLVLIVINGLLSMSELALVSASRITLEQAADRGSHKALAALKLSKVPTRVLSTVQIGITLIGILSGAFGEASLAKDLEAWLGTFESVAPYRSQIATTVVVLSITYLSIVIGELVPKRLAMTHPEAIAMTMARPMAVLSAVARPIVAFLTASTNGLLRLFRVDPHPEPQVSEEEVRGMIEKGAETGVFHKAEHALIERVLDLGDLRVKGLMVPRPDVIWLPEDVGARELHEQVKSTPRSHFPVCRGGLDEIVGVVHLKDLVNVGRFDDPLSLAKLVHPPVFVPESIPAIELLESFRKAETHIAFVLDEYGSVEGIVTLNDVVAAILGHVSRPADEPLEVQRADGSWLLDGGLPIRRLRELMSVEELPGESSGYDTAAGFVLSQLGRIPKTGETFTWERFRFEVIDMDGGRIDKLLFQELPEPAPPAEEPA